MTTTYHDPIASLAMADAATFNAPLGQLDAMLNTLATSTDALDTRMDLLVLAGSNVSTLTNGAANAGQKVVTVDSTTGFLAGAPVAYTLVGGVIETNTVDTVDSPTQLTMTTNLGTGGIANDTFVSVVPLGSLISTGTVDGATSERQRFINGAFLGPNASLVADDSALLIGRDAVNPLASGGSHGVRDESTYYYAAGGYASFDANPEAGGAGGMNHVNCFQARPCYSGAGTLDGLWGMTFQPTIEGPVTNCLGVYILNPTYAGAGDIDGVLAGVYINPLSGGDLGSYGIYVAGEFNLSIFNGGVLLGGSTGTSWNPTLTAESATAYGVKIANPAVSGDGAVSGVLYGVYIAELTRGALGNYGIYQEGASLNYFGGTMTMDGALDHNGTTVGFYGVAPTTRQLLATGAGATVDNVITALQTLGLVKQS